MLSADVTLKQNLNLQMNLNPNQSLVKSKATATTCGKKFLFIWKTNALIPYLKYKLNKKTLFTPNEKMIAYVVIMTTHCVSTLKIRFTLFLYSYNEKDLTF